MKAIGTKILLQKLTEEKATTSGIILVHNDNSQEIEAKVLSVGDNCKFIKEGDKILVNKFKVDDFTYNGEEYFTMDETSVLVKL